MMQVYGQLPGAWAFPKPSLDLNNPEVHVVPKWERAADLQVTAADLGYAVDSFVDERGQVVTGSRLDRAKAELRRSIDQLPSGFAFNFLFYDECVMSCWATTQPADAANKAAAFQWIHAVQPDGWTNTGHGVATALGEQRNTTVVLLSDGAPNFMDCAMNYVGTYDQHRALINTQNTQGARVHCFGIGVATDADARGFLQAVAGDTGGTYVEIN